MSSACRHSAVRMNSVRRSPPPSIIANGAPVLAELGALQDVAALGDPDNRVPGGGDPDRALGVEADAVGAEMIGEHAPVRQPAVRADVERGEPARERLGNDQRPVVGCDDHAVRELDVVGDLT